jgi:hypothetical protein
VTRRVSGGDGKCLRVLCGDGGVDDDDDIGVSDMMTTTAKT